MGRPDYKVIDLFSGAGGLTLGFKWAGFEPVFAVEKESDFSATYAENFGRHIVSRKIEDVAKGASMVRADVVIGGPPCQGFSNLTGNKSNDVRRGLWTYFMDVIEASGAKVFVCENVPNLVSSAEGGALIRRAKRAGFTITERSVGTLMASDFGVPQNRKRAFIIGSKLGELPLPEPTTAKRRTVREAFAGKVVAGDRAIPLKPLHPDLPVPAGQPANGSQLHIARNPHPKSIERYKTIPPGGNRFDLQRTAPHLAPDCWLRKSSGGTDLFGRLWYDQPARCTIRTEFYKPEKGRYLHPVEHRAITHWEAARLQTFPDSFRWHGSKIRIAVQIGNAVPPLLAEALGNQVQSHLREQRHRPVARPKPSALRRLLAGV